MRVCDSMKDTVVETIRVGDCVLEVDHYGQVHFGSGRISWRTIRAIRFNMHWFRSKRYKVSLSPEHRLNNVLKRLGATEHRPHHTLRVWT